MLATLFPANEPGISESVTQPTSLTSKKKDNPQKNSAAIDHILVTNLILLTK